MRINVFRMTAHLACIGVNPLAMSLALNDCISELYFNTLVVGVYRACRSCFGPLRLMRVEFMLVPEVCLNGDNPEYAPNCLAEYLSRGPHSENIVVAATMPMPLILVA